MRAARKWRAGGRGQPNDFFFFWPNRRYKVEGELSDCSADFLALGHTPKDTHGTEQILQTISAGKNNEVKTWFSDTVCYNSLTNVHDKSLLV